MLYKKKILSYFLILIVFSIACDCFSKDENDSCNFSEVRYPYYEDAKNIKVLLDTIHFKGYILFKFNKIDSSRLYFEVYFAEKLNDIYNFDSLYLLVIDNWLLYLDKAEWWISNRLTTIGSKNKEKDVNVFDRMINPRNIKGSVQTNKYWTYSTKTKSIFSIYKTSFDGILISNDLLSWHEENYKEEEYKKNVKVLVPYVKYIPLEVLIDEELLDAGFFRTGCPNMK